LRLESGGALRCICHATVLKLLLRLCQPVSEGMLSWRLRRLLPTTLPEIYEDLVL
jgi:hypothetical protein